MLYLLLNTKKQNHWQVDFENNLMAGLQAIKADFAYGDYFLRKKLGEFTQDDYLFVMHHEDLDRLEVRLTPARIICHQHGTAVNPFTPMTDRVSELEQFYNVTDLATFHSQTAMELTKQRYPFIHSAAVIGTPKDSGKYSVFNLSTKKRKIVVAGDQWPHKQFYLAAFLLRDLVHFYDIVFCFMNREYEGPAGKMDWVKYYDLERYTRMGYRIKFTPNPDDFYRELADAEIYFTASVGDVISSSAIEAHLCGCYVVVPEIHGFWPCFMDYISNGYEPFSQKDVERVIQEKPVYKFNYDLFRPASVAARLMDAIKNYK